MKWSVILPLVRSVVETSSGLVTTFRDGRMPFVDPEDGATCFLHVISSGNDRGTHDFRKVFNEDTNKLDLIQAGIRLFTMSVMVESYDQDDNRIALEYLEDVRDALDRPQILSLFRTIGLTVRNIAPSIDLSKTEEDHMVSAASMDVFFAYANNVFSSDGKPGLEPLDWIEQVGGEGTTSEDVTPITAELDGEVEP